jgi:predicted nuclease of predicted toxin-antitoxin system
VAFESSFLIDECLSPDLAKLARGRGFHALHVNEAKLRRKSDKQVATYALAKDMILVTNNRVDFDKIYKKVDLHPGLIFIEVRDPDLMDAGAQRIMFSEALDEVQSDEPVNEAIKIELYRGDSGRLEMEISRYQLPE